MFSKIGMGKPLWYKSIRNVIVAIFKNKNKKGKVYGIIYVTLLQGKYKDNIAFSIPEWERFLEIVKDMPKIEKKDENKS